MPVSKHAAAAAYTSELTKLATPVPSPADVGMKYLQIAALGLPLMAAGGHLASAVYDKMTEASRKANAFKSMMEQNPHLHDRDKVTVQRYFNTLHHVNPHLAQEPTIAASYVHNMLTTSDPAKAMQPHRDVFQTALTAGKGAPSALSGVSDALQGAGKAVGDLYSALDTSRQQKVLGQMRQIEAQRDARRQQLHLGLARRRAQSATRGEAAAQQSLNRMMQENQQLADLLRNRYGHQFP